MIRRDDRDRRQCPLEAFGNQHDFGSLKKKCKCGLSAYDLISWLADRVDMESLAAFLNGWDSALKAAIEIVMPSPHKEEERECQDVAEAIEKLYSINRTLRSAPPPKKALPVRKKAVRSK